MPDTTEYRGYTIKIKPDQYPEDPRRECDELGTMVCFHNRHALGDTHKFTTKTIQQLVKRRDVIALPLYLLDHSGITMRTTPFQCPWDSGQVGFIFITKEAIRKEFNVSRVSPNLKKHVTRRLRGEVETYNHFLTGDVYCYEVFNNKGDLVESVCGYYGYDHEKSGLMVSARAAVDYDIKKR